MRIAARGGARAVADAGVPAEFVSAVGAQVMVTRNTRAAGGRPLANGTRGVLLGIAAGEDGAPTGASVRLASGAAIEVPFVGAVDADGPAQGGPAYVPLQNAFAISIHKAQGATLDAVEVDLNGVFAPGQAYVALSRARDLGCARVTGATPATFQCHPAVREFYRL